MTVHVATESRRRTAPVALLALLLCASRASTQFDELRVGHWVRAKGGHDAQGLFIAEEIELRAPEDEESMLGSASEVDAASGRFVILGQRMHVSARTEWDGVDWSTLEGARVEVEGHWRGPLKFSARSIEARRPGRDRLEGRIDAIERISDGELLVSILGQRLRTTPRTVLVHEAPVSGYAFAPPRPQDATGRMRDDDDELPGTLSLGEDIHVGGQLQWDLERRSNFDLDDAKRADREDTGLSLRSELVWEPDDDFTALLGLRAQLDVKDEQGAATTRDDKLTLTEAWGWWRSPFGGGVDIQVGRQDFDEPREWIYDENLDAVRVHAKLPGSTLELSASTVLDDGSTRDEESVNLIAYFSNDDAKRHLAAWVVDRRDGTGVSDKPIHFGVRALGDWLPDQDLWVEAAALRGYDDTQDLRGWGIDVGTTWSPPALDPAYLIVGWARGSGDDSPGDGVDESFRQTGFQDNNGKFGGVTSYRYYGELFDPELSNLDIATLGIGTRLGDRSSIDLVWHSYAQVEAATKLLDTGLKAKPDGVHRDLGDEIDLVFGTRRYEPWDVELVLGRFMPGDAFPGKDDAWIAKLQIRCRF